MPWFWYFCCGAKCTHQSCLCFTINMLTFALPMTWLMSWWTFRMKEAATARQYSNYSLVTVSVVGYCLCIIVPLHDHAWTIMSNQWNRWFPLIPQLLTTCIIKHDSIFSATPAALICAACVWPCACLSTVWIFICRIEVVRTLLHAASAFFSTAIELIQHIRGCVWMFVWLFGWSLLLDLQFISHSCLVCMYTGS